MDVEAGVSLLGEREKFLSVSNKDVRNSFARKVYSLVAVQLLITTGVSWLIYSMGSEFIRAHITAFQATSILTLIMAIALTFSPSMLRSVPINYFLLGLFTGLVSVQVGFICALYTVQSVLYGVGITAAIVTTLTIIAFTTKTDFTGWLPYAVVVGWCLIGFSILTALFGMPVNQGGLAVVTSLLFGVYLVIDTQMIFRGEGTYKFTVDDYVLAAMCIYLDIVNLFIKILQLIGRRR